MSIQYEKTKATLDLLYLDIKTALERLDNIVEEIHQREKKLEDSKTIRSTNERKFTVSRSD